MVSARVSKYSGLEYLHAKYPNCGFSVNQQIQLSFLHPIAHVRRKGHHLVHPRSVCMYQELYNNPLKWNSIATPSFKFWVYFSRLVFLFIFPMVFAADETPVLWIIRKTRPLLPSPKIQLFINNSLFRIHYCSMSLRRICSRQYHSNTLFLFHLLLSFIIAAIVSIHLLFLTYSLLQKKVH